MDTYGRWGEAQGHAGKPLPVSLAQEGTGVAAVQVRFFHPELLRSKSERRLPVQHPPGLA